MEWQCFYFLNILRNAELLLHRVYRRCSHDNLSLVPVEGLTAGSFSVSKAAASTNPTSETDNNGAEGSTSTTASAEPGTHAADMDAADTDPADDDY